MICSARNVFSVYGLNESARHCRQDSSFGRLRTCGALQFTDSNSKELSGQSIDVTDRMVFSNLNVEGPVLNHVKAPLNKVLRWWEKNLHPNMIEINSAQHLVDSLLIAGDKLVIVCFFSPSCGGCKTLHPKLCQLAESNLDAIFLTVNTEEMSKMSSVLRVNVVPFFRFYRGAGGRLCSFSCTTATIMKFQDAMKKYSAEEYIGPVKGLEDHELLAFASIGEISRKIDNDKIEHLGSNDSDSSIAVGKKFEEKIVGSK